MILDQLQAWKNQKKRKPLQIDGARQVCKSYLHVENTKSLKSCSDRYHPERTLKLTGSPVITIAPDILARPGFVPHGGPSTFSHQAVPSLGRRNLRRSVKYLVAAGVIEGMRPLPGSVMIDVRNLPLTINTSDPGSTQKLL
ncbi:MAG: hypothetical protein ABGY96_01495 [bacterium]|nr:hypothetical protein [Gammaproteobacteria bacterium]HIL96277.1 hypothetical protein [Pseudomonadales bacterium]